MRRPVYIIRQLAHLYQVRKEEVQVYTQSQYLSTVEVQVPTVGVSRRENWGSEVRCQRQRD